MTKRKKNFFCNIFFGRSALKSLGQEKTTKLVVLSLTHDVGDEGKNTFMLSKLLADAASLPELPKECSSFNPEDVAMIIWYGK